MPAFSSLALVAAGIGTAISVKNQLSAGTAEKKAGEAEQRAANSQADLSDYNAAVADVQAQDAHDRGALAADRFRARTRALIGEQRVGFAAGNIDVGFGSTVDVQADAAFLGELDALTVRTDAAREAWGFKIEAEDRRKGGEIQRQEGVNAAASGRQRQSASRWNAAGTVFSSAGSLLEAKYGFGRGGR